MYIPFSYVATEPVMWNIYELNFVVEHIFSMKRLIIPDLCNVMIGKYYYKCYLKFVQTQIQNEFNMAV